MLLYIMAIVSDGRIDPRIFVNERGATISDDGRYRYDLTRIWGDGRMALWIMLNPSTADADIDDPTIRRVRAFTQREGLDGCVVVNLFALRSTDPMAILASDDPDGPANALTHNRWFTSRRISLVVAAWGAWPERFGRNAAFFGHRIVIQAAQAGHQVMCLGVTKGGQPRHPLYVKRDTPLQPFKMGSL